MCENKLKIVTFVCQKATNFALLSQKPACRIWNFKNSAPRWHSQVQWLALPPVPCELNAPLVKRAESIVFRAGNFFTKWGFVKKMNNYIVEMGRGSAVAEADVFLTYVLEQNSP